MAHEDSGLSGGEGPGPQPEDTIYVVIPDGPLSALRPFYKQRIEEANRIVAGLAQQPAEGESVSFADARRLECLPSGMMMFTTPSKVVIKSSRESPVHVTVAAYDRKLDLHVSDENMKKQGEQWWRTLGSVTPESAAERVAAARKAAAKFEREHTAIIRVLDPTAVGFIMSPMTSLTADSRVPLIRSGRRAVPAFTEYARRAHFELVDSFKYSDFPGYKGGYFHAADDGVFFSEQGRMRFLLSDSQQPEGVLLLSNADFAALAEVFLKTLFGIDSDDPTRLFFPGFW